MNKSLTISLGGKVFHIEEDAYESLSQYLKEIELKLNASEAKEILQDIESRIAELLMEFLSKGREVVMLDDIEKIKETVGSPKDFEDENQAAKNSEDRTVRKQLFRDIDRKVIGGVCSGLSHYIGIDVVWVRLIFLFFLLFGFSFISFYVPTISINLIVLLIYLILWIVIPAAKTTSDKLKMMGKPINLESIKELVELESSELNKKTKDDSFSKFMFALIRVFVIFIGLFFLLLGVGFTVAFLSLLISQLVGEDNYLSILQNYIFENDTQFYIGIFSASFLWLIPAFALIQIGIGIIFPRISFKKIKFLNISLVVIFFMSLFGGIYSGVGLASEYKTDISMFHYEDFEIAGDTIVLNLLQSKDKKRLKISFDGDEIINGIYNEEDSFRKKIINEIEIKTSEDNLAHLEIEYKATGSDKKKAQSFVKNIHYDFKLNSIPNSKKVKSIDFNNFLSLKEPVKFRNQMVYLTLHVPNNKIVKAKGFKHVYSSMPNKWNDYWDNQNNSYRIVGDSLVCLDCPKVEKDSLEYDDKDVDIKIESGNNKIIIK